MYEQIRGDLLFIILYSMVTAMAMMASCYLLLRRGNAFAPDIFRKDNTFNRNGKVFTEKCQYVAYFLYFCCRIASLRRKASFISFQY